MTVVKRKEPIEIAYPGRCRISFCNRIDRGADVFFSKFEFEAFCQFPLCLFIKVSVSDFFGEFVKVAEVLNNPIRVRALLFPRDGLEEVEVTLISNFPD